jgi:hypothetical protein
MPGYPGGPGMPVSGHPGAPAAAMGMAAGMAGGMMAAGAMHAMGGHPGMGMGHPEMGHPGMGHPGMGMGMGSEKHGKHGKKDKHGKDKGGTHTHIAAFIAPPTMQSLPYSAGKSKGSCHIPITCMPPLYHHMSVCRR